MDGTFLYKDSDGNIIVATVFGKKKLRDYLQREIKKKMPAVVPRLTHKKGGPVTSSKISTRDFLKIVNGVNLAEDVFSGDLLANLGRTRRANTDFIGQQTYDETSHTLRHAFLSETTKLYNRLSEEVKIYYEPEREVGTDRDPAAVFDGSAFTYADGDRIAEVNRQNIETANDAFGFVLEIYTELRKDFEGGSLGSIDFKI